MKLTEMEQALNNFDRRLSATAQILPTLATKTDLERFATKDDLRDGLAGLKTELLIRIETLDDKFNFLADGFESHSRKLEKLEPLAEGFALLDTKVDAIGVGLRGLTEQLKRLTDRLERKGVI